MADKIISINRDVLKKKVTEKKEDIVDKTKEKAEGLFSRVKKAAVKKKDDLQNKLVDGSLYINDKQREALKKLKK